MPDGLGDILNDAAKAANEGLQSTPAAEAELVADVSQTLAQGEWSETIEAVEAVAPA